ncbi:MAG: hydrogenase iron-sulfur subunit [Thermoplasmata archaeon]|jgi:Fe-S oxidoreductase/coenzyme F420-reducing hydrogenase delta subunit|nr:hydrogenase iron-sulfur subunit [Thermoplasmata archaeon]
MTDPKFEPQIVALCCNWCSYAGADLAGVSRMQYPPNARVIRVMCSGRVEPYFILRALELGADGVLIAGCHIGDCHYISGNVEAEKRMEATKEVLDRLGIGRDRMRLEWISASEGQKFAQTMKDFTEQIRRLGPNPLAGKLVAKKPSPDLKKKIDQLIEDTGAFDCVECGKCTTVCPVAKYDPDFAPRTIVLKSMEGQMKELSTDKAIWTCITCEQCNSMCPYKVDYSGFIRGLRTEAAALDNVPVCSQGGLMQGVMRVQANGSFKQDRLKWLTQDLKVADKGEYFLFTGCAVYFDAIFRDRQELRLADIPRAAVKIMNRAGIVPVVSNDEVCCGHDLNWTGDEDGMMKLMKKNVDLIKASGAKKVVFTCPECLRTFNMDYQDFLGDFEFELVHISQLVDDLLKEGKIKLKKGASKVTFQDSCRLGRHMGIYDEPRAALRGAQAEVVEMDNSRDKALCCGVSAWATCDEVSKKMQVDRLKEAKRTGAECLVTGCYKCLIHLNCAQVNKTQAPKEQIDIPIKDLSVFIADALE